MYECIKSTADKTPQLTKQWQKDGYVSAHWLARHGYSATLQTLRKLARSRDDLRAKWLNTHGTFTWWYMLEDVARLEQQGLLKGSTR